MRHTPLTRLPDRVFRNSDEPRELRDESTLINVAKPNCRQFTARSHMLLSEFFFEQPGNAVVVSAAELQLGAVLQHDRILAGK